MKRIGLIVTLCILFLGVTQLSAKGIIGNGNVKKDTRIAIGFQVIKINGAFNVFLSQGDKESLVIEADDNLLEYIKSGVHNQVLEIGMKSSITIKQSKKMNIYITLKDINEINYNGVGDLKCLTNLNINELKVQNNGVGNVTLKGSATSLIAHNTGVGNFNSFNFEVQNCKLRNSGVGNVEVYASNELRVSNSGVGNVLYYGEPKMVDIDSNGIGSVRKK